MWQDAEVRGHLERRSPLKVYPTGLADRILLGEAAPDEGLDPAWSIFVTHDVGSDHKMSMAQRLRRENEAAGRVTLQNFEPVLREALTFLGVPVPALAQA